MPADTSVKFFHSAMPGAPSLTNVAGSMIAVLDACLVNGFGTGTVDSIVVSGGVATVTRGAGHPFEVGAVAFIQGAAPAALNGEQKVLSVTATAYTFDATGVSNQTATGAITHKLAAAGWARPFGGTNLATYKSNDGAATGCVLRVDDTGTTQARVVGYESMTGVSTGVGPFPTAAQASGGGYWGKAANATPTTWFIAADSRAVIVHLQYSNAAYGGNYFFGDLVSFKSPDAFACMLSSSAAAISTAPSGGNELGVAASSDSNAQVLARSYTGLGGSIPQRRSWSRTFHDGASNVASGGGNCPYPNPVDGALYLSPVLVSESLNAALRGVVPGFYACPQNALGAFPFLSRVDGVTAYPGRTFAALPIAGSGVAFVDVVGPWR